MDNVIRPRTYWKESTLTRHKIFFHFRDRGIRPKNFITNELFEKFLQWVESVYPYESTAWLITDWFEAYVEFDNLVDKQTSEATA